MARFIDAEELEREGWQLVRPHPKCPVALNYKRLNEVPTAFDLDNVITTFEEIATSYQNSNDDYCKGKAFAYRNSIDIVKHYGLAEEYKSEDSEVEQNE